MAKGHSLLGSQQAHLRRGGGNVVHGCYITGTYLTYSATIFLPGLTCAITMAANYNQADIKTRLAALIGHGATVFNISLTRCWDI